MEEEEWDEDEDEDESTPVVTFSLPVAPARPNHLPINALQSTHSSGPVPFTIPSGPIGPAGGVPKPDPALNSAKAETHKAAPGPARPDVSGAETQMLKAPSGPAKPDFSAAQAQMLKALSESAKVDVSSAETRMLKTPPKSSAKPVAPSPPSPPAAAWKASILANQISPQKPVAPAPSVAAAKKPETSKPKPARLKVSSEAVGGFLRRFHALLESGVPLVSSLGFLADSEDHVALRQVLEQLAQTVSSGHRFSDALRTPALRSIFSPTLTSLVRLGEETGNLTVAVERAADLMDSELRIKRAVVTALTYPTVLLISISLAGLLFVSILGADGGLFAMFGNDLPLPTKILVAVARFLRQPLLIILGIAVVGGTGWAIHRTIQRNTVVRAWLHWSVLQIPGIGTLIRKTVASRMLYVMSNCIIVGLPLIQALRLMRGTCQNESILEGFDQVLKEFIEGVALSESLHRIHIFPPLVPSMMSVAEETGTLDQILEKLAAMLEDDVMTALHAAMLLVEPLLLLFAGCLAGFLAVATLLPIIELAQKL